jgi:hypothetical protein
MDSKGYLPLDAGGHSRVLLLGVAEEPTQWFEKQGYPVEKKNLHPNIHCHSPHSSWETFSTRDKALVLDDGRIPTWLILVRLGFRMDIGILDAG